MKEKDKKFYESAYKRASNKDLLSDLKGMKEGRYFRTGKEFLKKEIKRRKREGLMRKTAGTSRQDKLKSDMKNIMRL